MKALLGLILGRLILVGKRFQLYRVMPTIQATDTQLAEWFSLQESDWEVFVSGTLLWILAVEPALVAGPCANPALFAASIEKLIRAFPNEFQTLHANQPHLNENDMAHIHLKSRTKYLRVCKNKEVYCANGSGYKQWSRETKGMNMNIEKECKRRKEEKKKLYSSVECLTKG